MGARCRNWLEHRRGWQLALILFIAGAVMTFGFAPYHVWPVIFISLPIFYVLLTASNTRKQAIMRSFMFGYGYCMAGTWWIGNALLIDRSAFGWMWPFSVFGMSGVMALWFMLFGVLIYHLRRWMHVPMFAACWVLVEYARSVGIFGFPWNLAGYMALASLPVAQLASVVGTYGLSLLVVMLGLVPAYWMASASPARTWAATASALALLGACYAYGAHRLQTPVAMTNTLVRLVQPNISQSIKGTREGRAVTIKALTELTTALPVKTRVPDVVIWPETAYPFTMRRAEPQAVPAIKLLLTGTVRAEQIQPYTKIWNSLAVLNAAGDILAMYDKHQLVPLGEFVPLRDLVPFGKITPGDIDFSRGPGPQTIAVPGIPSFSPLVCYEGVFPWMAVDSAQRPDWIVNVTNDAWYGDSPGPYQHFEMVRMRAIEQGVPLARVANSGISAMIDPYGRVMASIALNQVGFSDVALPSAVEQSVYGHLGELLTFLAILLLFFCNLMVSFAYKK